MTAPFPVLIPLVNPNEAEALLAALHVREGQFIQPSDLIAELETTKSNAELLAEQAGYVRGLRAEVGQTLRAGARLCYLAASLEEPLPAESQPAASVTFPADGLRISEPARRLAAIQLARYLSSEEFLKKWSQPAGYLPVRPSSLDGWTDFNLRDTMTRISQAARLRPANDLVAGLGMVFQASVGQVLTRQADPQTAAQSAVERLLLPQNP